MRKWFALLLGVVLVAVFVFFFTHNPGPHPSPAQKTVEEQNAAVARALANQNTNTVAVIRSNFARVQSPSATTAPGPVAIVIPPAGPASPLLFTNFEPATVMQNMSRVIRQYSEMFGGNPVGNNQEITGELSGKNPKHINFISTDAGLIINGNGELVDPWGTPYFFHQLSGADTEIHSAGPDRIMWTADDIVVHSTQ